MLSFIEVKTASNGGRVQVAPNNIVAIQEVDGKASITLVNNFFRLEESFLDVVEKASSSMKDVLWIKDSTSDGKVLINPIHIVCIEKVKRTAKITVANNYFYTKNYYDEIMAKLTPLIKKEV